MLTVWGKQPCLLIVVQTQLSTQRLCGCEAIPGSRFPDLRRGSNHVWSLASFLAQTGWDYNSPTHVYPPCSHPPGKTGGTNTASDLRVSQVRALPRAPWLGIQRGSRLAWWRNAVNQLPQTLSFQDPASQTGRVSVSKEKNIREASSQELSKSKAQIAPPFSSISVAPSC